MANYSKVLLSASTNGKQIAITGNGTATANTIHTAIAGTAALDEVFVYVHNPAVSDTNFTIQWGGSAPEDSVITSVTGKAGRLLVVDGKLLQNGLVISGYTAAGTVYVDGFVNRIV